jgi:hypothetical protein
MAAPTIDQNPPCPCAGGAVGHGCASSFNPDGALLAGSGEPSVSADTLLLASSGTSSSVVTFFQGTSTAPNMFGVVLGDGARCVGGTLTRLGSKLAVGGAAQYPEPGDASVSVRGGVDALGGVRTYQVYYRNAADYCTSWTFNLTNGWAVFWRP